MGVVMTSTQAAGAASTIYMIVMLVIMFALMYFLMIRPQKKEQKRVTAMLNDIFIVFLLFVVFQETFQLLFFIFFVSAFFDGLTNLAHHCVVEIQIMQNAETHTQHLFRF